MTRPLFDYKKLFHTLPTRFIMFATDDPDFTIVEESDAHAAMVGMRREDVVGHPLFAVFPDNSTKYRTTGVSDLVESLRTVIKTKRRDTMAAFRYDIKDADGAFNERHWRVTHHPLLDDSGNVSLIFQETTDITEERRAGVRLKRVEEQLAQALSFGSIGTWLWDIKHDRIIGDKNLAAMFGISPDAAAAGLALSTFLHAIHKDDRDWVGKAIANAVKNKEQFEEEYRTIGSDGTMRWVIARGRAEADSTGEAGFFPGVLVDITERKLAEKNLQFLAQAGVALAGSLDYKKTLRTIAKRIVPDIADWCGVDLLNEKSGVIDQVAIVHKDPAKVRWAKELRRKYPVQAHDPSGSAEVIRSGKPQYYPVVTPEMIKATSQSAEQLQIMKEIGINSVIIVPLTVNGVTIGTISLVLNEQGRHYTKADFEMAQELANRASMAMSNAFLYQNAQKEIVKRRTLEDELRQANEKLESRVRERTMQLEATNASLEQSNRELQDFAYVASHDLQEPLRKIQAFGNLLDSEYAERLGDGRDYLLRMRNAASRMSTLIEDLLSFSRVTTKAREFTTIDLATIAREVTGDLETRIQDTGGTVHIRPLPKIQADPLQMRQLLQNLISNALKFHKASEAPVVTVSAKIMPQTAKYPEQCVIRVQDNGVGFDEKYLDRIFSVFQRLHSRDNYEGTGIGLAVCRKIAERHSGTITAQSAPGAGSTFIVTLPVKHKHGRKPYDRRQE